MAMVANHRELLDRCVEEGLRRGITRAHKHKTKPTHTELFQEIYDSILNEIYLWFNFDDDEQNDV